eukprot:snap_masked-scaffold_1-processed-gene-5.29-mRNA-1 protein AED:0.04 eAED:0.04 QI:0/-1/0/1/-1/1/1/0/450
MKVLILHPDLGLGGGERLILDIGVALKKRGHEVVFYTSYFDPKRCFEELKEGGDFGPESVKVFTSWFPKNLFGVLHLFLAAIKMIYISLYVVLFQKRAFDIIICDQVSHMIPVLNITHKPVLFYCHFPDQLLCTERSSILKKIYRFFFDFFEEQTTLSADYLLVNSEFTKNIFFETFKSANSFKHGKDVKEIVSVLYPSVTDPKVNVDLRNFQGLSKEFKELAVDRKNFLILSLNRFELKKNLRLALDALKQDLKQFKNVHLVFAGGYDKRLQDNEKCLSELKSIVSSENLTNVHFFLNVSIDEKNFLLESALCLVYTPENEHFGIVPIEAMAKGKPVIAHNSGGPRETVLDGETGFLVDNAKELREKVELIRTDKQLRESMESKGRERVKKLFSFNEFGDKLEKVCLQLVEENKTGEKRRKARFFLSQIAMFFLCLLGAFFLHKSGSYA